MIIFGRILNFSGKYQYEDLDVLMLFPFLMPLHFLCLLYNLLLLKYIHLLNSCHCALNSFVLKLN